MRIEEIPKGKILEIYITRGDRKVQTRRKTLSAGHGIVVTELLSQKFVQQVGDRVDVVYSDGSVYYKWESVKYLTHKLKDGNLVGVFASSVDVEKSNRRRAYRVQVVPKEVVVTNEISMDSIMRLKPSELASRNTTFKGTIHDASKIGAGVICEAEFAINDTIKFSFESDAGMIECTGKIVNMRPNGDHHFYGISYFHTSSNYIAYLNQEQTKEIIRKRYA